MTPLFTVIIPAWNARDTIAETVRSVLAQTEPRFELLIVDDGSPDDSAAVALRAANGDPRVRVSRRENGGPALARNAGIAATAAPLIAFLDADDLWAPDCLARHRDHFAQDPSLGVSFARVRFFNPAMTTAGRVSAHVPSLDLARALGENAFCTTSNLVARRAVFDEAGGFAIDLTHAEDQEWAARVLAVTAWRVRGIDAVLVDYRTSVTGLSADLDRMRAGWRAMLTRIQAVAPAVAEAPAAALFERYLARRALRTGQPAARAFHHLAAALRHSPMALLTHEPRRTLLTSAGILAAALLPRAWVRTAIAR